MGGRKRANSSGDLHANPVGVSQQQSGASSSSQPPPTQPNKKSKASLTNSNNSNNEQSAKRKKAAPKRNDDDDDENSTVDAIAELHVFIGNQQSEINELRSTVVRQQQQIDMLLAAFGLQNVAAVGHSSSSPRPPDAANAAADDAMAVDTGSPPSQTTQSASYSSAAMQPAAVVKQVTNAVVSAVYRDLGEKERRASNIVVNGLTSSSDDKAAVSQLLNAEFKSTPNIVKCRRLGKPVPGKVQPLLVVLGSATEANTYISLAKRLRKSSSDQVRQHVFINADVTRAEALAAYQMRCQRRERSTRAATSSSAAAVGHQQSGPAGSSSSSGTAGLNATAPLFVPLGSSSSAPGALPPPPSSVVNTPAGQ